MRNKVLDLKMFLVLFIVCICGIIFSIIAIDNQIDNYIEEIQTEIIINNKTDLLIELQENDGQLILTIDDTDKVTEEFYGIVSSQEGLNIRSGPSIDSEKTGTLYYGVKIKIIEDCGDWYKTENGYVFKDYIIRI